VALTGLSSVDNQTITGTTPPHDASAVDLVLSGDPSGDLTSAGAFTYAAAPPPSPPPTPAPGAPTFTAINPASGDPAGGTSVTITGTNLGNVTNVTLGGVALTGLSSVDAQTITGTTPPHDADAVDLVLSGDPSGDVTAAGAFTYAAAPPPSPAPSSPTFTAINPSSGDSAGGTSVTITGTNLGNITNVTLGGVALTALSSVDAQTITGTTPPHDAGDVDLVLSGDPSGDVTAGAAFRYAAASHPPGTASNLQWLGADGTPLTNASAGDSVTASFDLAHDDSNQVTVSVYSSDQVDDSGALKSGATATATPTAMERQDQSGFTAPWVVGQGDGFYFTASVTNSSQSANPNPPVSPELTVGPAPPPRDYYYPDENPVFDYAVSVRPNPPADTGQILYHQGAETGTVLNRGDLNRQGTGRLHVDLSSFRPDQDSPVWLEFLFSKSGQQQRQTRAVALALRAPKTVQAPATANPGDTVNVSVTDWSAIVFDTQGTGTARDETDSSRIPPAVLSTVKWRVAGQDTAATGDSVSITIPAVSTSDDTILVEAFLPTAPDHAAQAKVQFPPPAAHLTLAADTVVVKKAGCNPPRVQLTLKTDAPFSRTGTLQRSSEKVSVFTAATGGTDIFATANANVFQGSDLGSAAGVVLFVEGAQHSDALNDVTLTLHIDGGTDQTVQLTVVEVTLDICKSRSTRGTDPAPMAAADKAGAGRFLQRQDAGGHAGRARLIVRQAAPAAWTGSLVLVPLDARVQLMGAETGGSVVASPQTFANSAIDATNGTTFWVEGVSTSGALADTGFNLGIQGGPPDGDCVKMTVVEFTKITATINPTPANTARAGFPGPAVHTFDSTSIAEGFTDTLPLVLLRNAQPDTVVNVTCAPAGLDVLWQAYRDSADHAALGGAANVPTVTRDGADKTKATLQANEKGSFHVRAFLDANGTGNFVENDPSIPLNLILANVTVVSNNSSGNTGSLTSSVNAAGTVSVTNGTWPAGATVTSADLTAAGMGMELIADVTGGGADGRLGLDKVFCGLVNNLRNVDIQATYVDSTVAPPQNHQFTNVYVSNGAAATGGGTTFLPGDPAPATFSWPLLDTGRPSGGLGGESATMTRSLPHTSVDRTPGQRWTMRCVDSPGRSFPKNHPGFPAAVIARVHYIHQFTAYFCWWTNVSKSRGQSGDPADRVYSVVQVVPWECVGEWTVNFPAAPAAPSLTVVTTHEAHATIGAAKNPIERAQDNGCEVRPPSGITTAIGWDARA
jgi:hypothetical protein